MSCVAYRAGVVVCSPRVEAVKRGLAVIVLKPGELSPECSIAQHCTGFWLGFHARPFCIPQFMDMLKIDWPVSLKLPVGNTVLLPTADCPHPVSF